MASIPSVKKSYIALLIAVFGWGLSTTFIDFGIKYSDPYLFLALRFLLATLVMAPYILYTRKNAVFELFKHKTVYFIGFFESTGLLSQYIAQGIGVSAGLSALISMMFILIVPFFAFFMLDEHFSLNHAFAIVLGLVGVFFIVTEGDLSRLGNGSAFGIFILLISALSYALYQLFTSKYTRIIHPQVDTLVLFFNVMIIISIISGVSALTNAFFTPITFHFEAFIWIVLLVIFSTIIAFIAYFEGTKGLKANTISIILLSQALVPFFVDIFILRINYSPWIYFGGVIILVSMWFVIRVPTNDSPITLPISTE